jgi:hypothetical protein
LPEVVGALLPVRADIACFRCSVHGGGAFPLQEGKNVSTESDEQVAEGGSFLYRRGESEWTESIC